MNGNIFDLNTIELAESLLGMELIHESPRGTTAGIIVEVEAYLGHEDKASHAYNKRITKRTQLMYGPPGYASLYYIRGKNLMLNITANVVGQPHSILVRALQPTMGIELMARRRDVQLQKSSDMKKLCSGPGKLTEAMGIQYFMSGHYLLNKPLYLVKKMERVNIACGPRINIDYAQEAKNFLLRFWIENNPYISKKPKN